MKGFRMNKCYDIRRITINQPISPDRDVRFTIDQSNGGQPQKRHTLVLDRTTGKSRRGSPSTARPPAGRREAG